MKRLVLKADEQQLGKMLASLGKAMVQNACQHTWSYTYMGKTCTKCDLTIID